MRWLWISVWLGAILAGAPPTQAQSYGHNLIINGDAETGSVDSSGSSPVTAISGWNKMGAVDILTYASGKGIDLSLGDLAPLDHGSNYFSGGPGGSTTQMSQTIDLSAAASDIDKGTVTCAVSAYLGGNSTYTDNVTVAVTFNNGAGMTVGSIQPGAVSQSDRDLNTGLLYRRNVGPVPAGARTAVVSVVFHSSGESTNYGYADNLSLILNGPAAPQSVLGANLVLNGDAESGPSSSAGVITQDVPGWSRIGALSVDGYDDPDGDKPAATGLATPGKNFFWGGPSNGLSQAYQLYDVSAAASPIDEGQVSFTLSGWIGGLAGQGDSATVAVNLYDWSNRLLENAVQIGPVSDVDRQGKTTLLSRSATGTVPSGTRYVRLTLSFMRTDGADNDGLADSISLVLSMSNAPAISKGVITAGAYGGFKTIAPGTWIEIYGENLASNTRQWSGSDFNGPNAPTSLDGTSVTVNGQAAYVYFIQPNQVDAQVPTAAGTGPGQVTVTTPTGTSAPFMVTVNALQPGLLAPSSFQVNGMQYVDAALPDGTYVLPESAIAGVNSRPAKPGETITLYGVGFGPVTPDMPAGVVVSGANSLNTPLQILFGGTPADISYQGLAPNFVGLYQFNVVVPAVPDNLMLPLTLNLGGTPGEQMLYTAVQR